MGQGMLEGVFAIGNRRVSYRNRLPGAAPGGGAAPLRIPAIASSRGKATLHADDCSDLEQVFDIRGETINAGSERGLYGRRDLNARQGLHQAVLPRRANESPGFDERAHSLFQKKGIAPGVRRQ